MGEVTIAPAACWVVNPLLLCIHPRSFGLDPYLNAEAALETVTGIPCVGVMTCAKHFIANNQEHWLSADVDDRTLHEMNYYSFLRSICWIPRYQPFPDYLFLLLIFVHRSLLDSVVNKHVSVLPPHN